MRSEDTPPSDPGREEDPSTDNLDPDSLPTEASPDGGFTPPSPEVSIRGYRILSRIGSGGMGEVFAAEQLRPIRRRVALKVIKLGMDSREVVARFASERQALALMSHPSIAGIYDAGITEEGRPFFAMELVRGEPIHEYCDRQRLGVRERIELFQQVCDGVQHAHQKGIIHRDLKPSNVLVTIQGDKPVPKIIDFGIAKATSQELRPDSPHTSLGAVIGTPEYMSPEQADSSGLDVDTRSDIYSLGVLLYELLVGARPFDIRKKGRQALAEVRRRIRSEEPPRPSTRVSRLGKTAGQTAQRRGHDLPRLQRQLRGDIDWIVMKALEKDRTRRYQTANALRMDLERHLRSEPVSAGPPGAAYRARKFVVRHRGGVVAAGLVLLALVAGTVGTTVGMLRAREAERRAQREAETARQVSDFLVDIFRVSDPDEAQGQRITAREILDQGAARISTSLRDQPLTQARMMSTIGTVYLNLGLYDNAERQLREALEQRRRLAGDDSLEVAESLHALATLHLRQGRYTVAESEAERSREIREAVLGPDHPDVAGSLRALAEALSRQGRYTAAVPLYERSLALLGTHRGERHVEVAEIRGQLGVAQWRRGDFESAEASLRRALADLEGGLGLDDARLAPTLNSLAAFYWDRGRFEEAEPLFLRTLEIKERTLGPEHPEVAHTLNNLGLIYDAQKRYDEAESRLRRSVEILEKALGVNHDTTAMGYANLAWILYRQGRLAEAEPLYRRAFQIYQRTVGTDHPSVAILLRDQAQLVADQGRPDEARELLRRAAEIWEATGGPDHPELASTLEIEARLLESQGRSAEAVEVYHRVLEIHRSRPTASAAKIERLRDAITRLGGKVSDPG